METRLSKAWQNGNSAFKYTLNEGTFTHQQRREYEENGYIIMKKLIEDDIIDQCMERFLDICEGRHQSDKMTLVKDVSFLHNPSIKGQYLYNKLHHIAFDDVFIKYVAHTKILDVVENFTGPNITAVNSQIVNKPPNAGALSSSHPLHQDSFWLPFNPVDTSVGTWTAMEYAHERNGALIVIPGSHKIGKRLPHAYPNWKNGHNIFFYEVMGHEPGREVVLEMDKGDTVFFHPLLLHGSGPNLTPGFRRSISCHYTTSDAVMSPLDPVYKEDLDKFWNKRKVYDFDYRDYIRARSRRVRGRRLISRM